MKKLLICAIAITSIIACKKSEDSTPAQLSVTKANVAGTYKITSDISTYSGTTMDNLNGSTIAGTPIPGDYEVCEKDDTYTFTASGNVTNNDAGTACSPATASTTLAYSVDSASKAIVLPSNVGQSGFRSGTVSSLTSTTLVVTNTETITSGGQSITYTNTMTFTKQ